MSCCPDCGTDIGARCPDACPRVVAWLESHCCAKPVRGQKLTTQRGWTIAMGTEECANSKGCEKHHSPTLDATWTNTPEWVICDACKVRTVTNPNPMLIAGHEGHGGRRSGVLCDECGARHQAAGHPEMEWREGRLVHVGAASAAVRATALALASNEVAAAAVACSCKGCGALSEPCASTCHEERRRREAPLVVLANAVPRDLDPVGWRAAVLAFAESTDRRDMIERQVTDFGRGIASVLRGEAFGGKSYEHVIAAYRRAIAQHKAPPPERKGATWRERGPRLVVDRGDE